MPRSTVTECEHQGEDCGTLLSVRTIETDQQARDLANHLLDPARADVAIILTTRMGEQTPLIDPHVVSDAVGNKVDVVVLPTGNLTRVLEDELPPKTHVYGGAGRAYPIGTSWVENLHDAPIRFVWTEADTARSTELLIEDALAMAREATRPTLTAVRAPERVTVTVGLVIPPARAIGATEVGSTVSIRREDIPKPIPADLPIDRILATGSQVTGLLDPTTGVVIPDEVVKPREALAIYSRGDLALAQVAKVAPKEAALALFPGVLVKVPLAQVTSNPSDRLTDLLTVDEVVAVRIRQTGRPDGQVWQLSMLDVDDNEVPVPAPSVLVGGPPWLSPDDIVATEPGTVEDEASSAAPEEADAATAEDEAAPENPSAVAVVPPSAPAPVAPVPSAPTPAPVGDHALRAEVDRLRRELAEATRRNRELLDDRRSLVIEADDLARENTNLRHQTTTLRAQLRKTRGAKVKADQVETLAPAFTDPADEFRHQVYLEWVRRIPAAEKPHRPLAAYTIGDGFLDSVADIEGVDRAKVIAVVVEVLTGLADTMPGREMHRLRAGLGAGTGAVDDDDLGTAWRVSLQSNTASARRLHFWRRSDGQITLAKIGVHDDMTI